MAPGESETLRLRCCQTLGFNDPVGHSDDLEFFTAVALLIWRPNARRAKKGHRRLANKEMHVSSRNHLSAGKMPSNRLLRFEMNFAVSQKLVPVMAKFLAGEL